MTTVEYTLLAISSLFVIVDPIAVVPSFLAMTSEATPSQRVRMARLACFIMVLVLGAFAILGERILKFLGIDLPAFQIAGGIVLLLVALDMLRAQRSRVQETREETAAGSAKDDIAVTPLAIPMLAGPGAISTAILLHNKAASFLEEALLCVAIVLVGAASYVILHFSAHGARWLNPIVMRITTRIMGLLLAAVAVQFIVKALEALRILPQA